MTLADQVLVAFDQMTINGWHPVVVDRMRAPLIKFLKTYRKTEHVFCKAVGETTVLSTLVDTCQQHDVNAKVRMRMAAAMTVFVEKRCPRMSLPMEMLAKDLREASALIAEYREDMIPITEYWHIQVSDNSENVSIQARAPDLCANVAYSLMFHKDPAIVTQRDLLSDYRLSLPQRMPLSQFVQMKAE